MLRQSLMASFAVATLLACSKGETSDSKAIFVRNDMKLISPSLWEQDRTAQAVGTLLDVIDIPGQVITKSYCSAVRISPRHILTAAHCVKFGGRKIFEPKYLAENADPSNLEFLSLGNGIRVLFRGELDKDTKANSWSDRPSLETVAYINKEMDFAVYDLGYDLGDGYLNLANTSFLSTDLKLYSFQNGTPLTVADGCTGKAFHGVLRHDCDSLTGSSGGLIVDGKNVPIALHTFSSAQNRGGEGVARGEFEGHAALEEDAKQTLENKKDSELQSVFWECRDLKDEGELKACRLGQGLNRATFLSTILTDIEASNPEVFAQIFPNIEESSAISVAGTSLTKASCNSDRH